MEIICCTTGNQAIAQNILRINCTLCKTCNWFINLMFVGCNRNSDYTGGMSVNTGEMNMGGPDEREPPCWVILALKLVIPSANENLTFSFAELPQRLQVQTHNINIEYLYARNNFTPELLNNQIYPQNYKLTLEPW